MGGQGRGDFWLSKGAAPFARLHACFTTTPTIICTTRASIRFRDEAISRLTSCGLNGGIVNGTREQERCWVVPMPLRFLVSNEPVTSMQA